MKAANAADKMEIYKHYTTTNRISRSTYEMCELFFSRIVLCDLDWGTITRALKDIDSDIFKDWHPWFAGWQGLSDDFEQLADEAVVKQRHVTAGEALLRAAACQHFSEFMHFRVPGEKNAARKNVTRLFDRAIPYLPQDISKVTIPYGDLPMPGYFIKAQGDSPGPTVIIVNGLESAKEVELFVFAKGYLERGVSVLLFDGPGQGVHIGHEPLVAEFEPVVGAALDHLEGMDEVDAKRIGIFGVSLGGNLAVRSAAAFPDRIRACVNFSGGFDYNNFATINPMVKNGFRYTFCVDTMEAAEEAVKALDLTGTPSMEAPLLCIHGRNDTIALYESCKKMMAWAAGEKRLISYPQERHVCVCYFQDLLPRAYDWLADRLDSPA